MSSFCNLFCRSDVTVPKLKHSNSNFQILKLNIMKKLAYITLIAAFIFGVQTQKAFSTELNAFEMEERGEGHARIGYDDAAEKLTISMATAVERERVIVQVISNRNIVIQEVFLVTNRTQTFEIDMAGVPGGAYTVLVKSKFFKESTRIKKK